MNFSAFCLPLLVCCIASIIAEVSTVPSSVRQDMSSPVATAFKDGVLDSLGLTASERHNLFRKSEVLSGTNVGQKCYALVYDKVEKGCAQGSDMDPNERMLEWVNFATCVEALSRSTRYWSSYAGYLREIPQMCFAVKRWRDTDRARDMYEAATSEKIAMIQFWRRSTHQAAEANGLERIERQQWMHNLSLLREHMQYDFQMSLKLQQVLDRHSDHIQQDVQRCLSKASKMVQKGLHAPLEALRHLSVQLETRTGALEMTVRDQQNVVTALVSAWEATIARHQLFNDQTHSELDALRQIHSDFKTLNTNLNVTHASLGLLLESHRNSWSVLRGFVFPFQRLAALALAVYGDQHRGKPGVVNPLSPQAWVRSR
ncbi:uncharacterized protein MEPE_03964 [Melanopsichium pennsylvanicum]|uniref:Uncharacterized protein n=1 Tax=Melanopsichium pennsylvanicum TaxID=63383 RepID=A0AAJ4XN13_9BASI|nr:uncharacterized protein MEPE_03964 [Melanopsichium pennsylvanicum]